MTDVMERGTRGPAANTGGCGNPRGRHGDSQAAWNRGCRCPEALAAHERDKARRASQAAAVDAAGNCIAERHDSGTAYREHGCRCPGAVAVHDRRLERSLALADARRRADPAYDPRTRWRGPDHEVSAFTLMMLLEGVMHTATRGEYVAAVAILDARVTRWGNPALTITEIAERLRINTDAVRRYRGYRVRNRDERAARRLADAQWKAKLR